MNKNIYLTSQELEKFGSSHQYTQEIQNYIKQVKKNPDPRYLYFVASPLGASEYWGANANGDIFPEEALNPKEKNATWGYKTFEQAKLYRRHKNKVGDDLAIGEILKAAYNTKMHRVEVVCALDREKAPDIAEKIDRGEMPGTSMGCRLVDGDVCTVCGNRATKRSEYCEHLRTAMGSLDKEGRIIGAINEKPIFFDYSLDVPKPAAAESAIFEKVASKGRIGSTEFIYIPWNYPPSRNKIEITELDLPDSLIEKLAEYNFKEVLATSNYLGIVFKPHEFQKLVFANIDDPALKVQAMDRVFAPTREQLNISFGPKEYNEKIASLLYPFFKKRTGYEPYVEMRKYANIREKKYKKTHAPLFKKIAALYNGYRSRLVSNLTRNKIDQVLLNNSSRLLDELTDTNYFLTKSAAEINIYDRMLGDVPLNYFKTVFL